MSKCGNTVTPSTHPRRPPLPYPGQLWNDRGRGPRMPVRILAVDDTHATVAGELDGERMPGTRLIHLSHFANGNYVLAEQPAYDTAAATIARSEAPVTTMTGLWVGFPTDTFVADIVTNGRTQFYVFAGDAHDPMARAVASCELRIGGEFDGQWIGILNNGHALAEHTREDCLRALVTALSD